MVGLALIWLYRLLYFVPDILLSSLTLLVSEGGELVHESVGKADLLLDHFDSK